MKAIFLACLLGVLINTHGQKKDTLKKIRIQPFFSVGIAEGKSPSATLLNTGVGLRYKTNQVGVGVGIDEYYLRTVPLYVEARKYMLVKKSTPFAYGAVGTNLPWTNSQDGFSYTGRITYEYGLGYQVPIAYRYSLFFTAGYSYKEFSSERSYPVFCITLPCPEQRQYFQYQLTRLTLKAGMNF